MTTAKLGRAAPLPPEERRASLIAATLDLIRQNGPEVSTRQIAQAAGVAEGTIFRAFEDKDSLLRAAVAQAFDHSEAIAQIEAIDGSLDLRTRLTTAVGLLQKRLRDLFSLILALRAGPPERTRSQERRDQDLHDAVTALIRPDRDQLTRSPEDVSDLLRMMVFAATHPLINEHLPLTPAEIVSAVLDGVRRREEDRSSC